MRSYPIRYIILVCLLFCLNANGQNAVEIITRISNPQGYENPSNDFGIAGATLEIDLNGVNKDTIDIEYIIDNGAIKVSDFSYTLPKAGTYNISAKAVSKNSGNEISVSPKTVTVYDGISVTLAGDWVNDAVEKVVWDDVERSLELSVKNDKSCTVSYSWKVDGQEDQNSTNKWTSRQSLTNVLNKEERIICSIEYQAPGGEVLKQWSQNFIYKIFHKPAEDDFYIQAKVGENTKYDAVYLYHESPLEKLTSISVLRRKQFDPAFLKFSWKKNGSELDKTDATLNHDAFQGEIENGQHTDTYTAHVAYRPDNRLDDYNAEYTIEVVTYKEPLIEHSYKIGGESVSLNEKDKLVIWDNTEIGFSCDYSGGRSDGWDFIWEAISQDNTSRISNNATADVRRYSVADNNKEYTIHLHATNAAPDNEKLYEYDLTFTVESWKKPDLSSKSIVRHVNDNADSRSEILYLYEGYDSDEYGKRYFSIPEIPNDPSVWRYVWKDGDDELSGPTTEYSPTASSETETRTITVSATYEPEGLLTGAYSWSDTVYVETLERPEFEVVEWKDTEKRFSVWEDTEFQLTTEVSGGVEDAWKYTWVEQTKGKGLSYSEKCNVNKFDNIAGDSLFTDRIIVHTVENSDPDGFLWYHGSCYANYRSYRKPVNEKVDVLDIYQGEDTPIQIVKFKEEGLKGYFANEIWDNSLMFADEGIVDVSVLDDTDKRFVKPNMTEPVLGLHDRLSVNYEMCIDFRPDEYMAESISYKDTIPFEIKYWPTPRFTVLLSDRTVTSSEDTPNIVRNGEMFHADIDVSDCITGDSLWRYSWIVDGDSYSDSSSIDYLCVNEGNAYKDIYVSAVVSNGSLEHWKDGKYEDTINFRIRINPRFNTADDSVVLRYDDVTDGRYGNVTISEWDEGSSSYVYSAMNSFDALIIPIELADNIRLIDREDWEIIETVNGNDIELKYNETDEPGFRFNESEDELIVKLPSVSQLLSASNSVPVQFKVNYRLHDDSRDIPLAGTFEPKFVLDIYRKPEISLDDSWDQSANYVVWDDTGIENKTHTISESTGDWTFRWSRLSDNNPVQEYDWNDGSMAATLDLNTTIGVRSDDTIRLVATCYAPYRYDSNNKEKTVWYTETFDRHFAVWKKPVREVSQVQTDNAGNCLKETESTLNVCALYSDDQSISLLFKDKYSVEGLDWIDTVQYSNVLLKDSFKENDKNKGNYEYATYTFEQFDNVPEITTISFNVISKAYPIIPEGSISLIDTVRFDQTLSTTIWPVQKYAINHEFHENGGRLIVQALSENDGIENPLKQMSYATEGGWGNPDNTVFEWSKGKDGDWKDMSTLPDLCNSDNVYQDSTYYVRCTVMGDDGLNWCEDSIGFYNVRCYPVVRIPYEIEGLDESVTDLIENDILHFKRLNTAYESLDGNWNYSTTLSLGGKPLYSSPKAEFEYVIMPDDAFKSSSLLLESQVTCEVENGFILRIEPVSTKIKVWPYDDVFVPEEFNTTEDGTPKTMVHKGMDGTILGCQHSNSYVNDDDWSYKWSFEGVEVADNINRIYSKNDKEIDDVMGYNDIKFVLKATYKPGNSRARDYELVFNLREFSAPNMKGVISQAGAKFREQDTDTLKIDDSFLKTGNRDGWQVTWMLDGAVLDAGSVSRINTWENTGIGEYVVKLPEIIGNGKMSENHKYSVRLVNQSPVGNVTWAEDEYPFGDIVVYNRPPKPDALVIKGGEANNTSGIFIAIYNDKNVKIPDYNNQTYFVFGKGNEPLNVDDKYLEPFYRYEDYQEGQDSKLWVKTKWVYSSFDCYSDPVLYEPVSNTRTSVGEISVGYMHFEASVESPEMALVRIIDSTGNVVQTLSFDADTDFNEEIDMTGLESGMYLIRVEIGGLSETGKILIR